MQIDGLISETPADLERADLYHIRVVQTAWPQKPGGVRFNKI